MRINIASLGPYHIYDLAWQMHRLGHLGQLYTAYPRWKLDPALRQKACTFPWILAPAAALRILGGKRFEAALRYRTRVAFAQAVARQLEPCDVFVWLSGSGLEGQRVAKQRYAALTVCDVGASHARRWEEIVSEEFARWGMPYRQVDPHLMARVLEEYAAADLITVPSSHVYRSFLAQGVPADKLAKLPYGVALALFRPAPKQDDTFRVIYVGALSLRKGIPYLLEALAPLRLAKFELWLIGPRLPETEAFLARHAGRFRYLGAIPREKLYAYLSQGSLFVLPSIEEGLALVLAQAMACGLPVIATTNTGAGDLVTDGREGFVVPIRSPEAIREKLIFLYEHPELRAEMGQAALARVQALRGWDAYGEQAAATYEAALARQRRSRAEAVVDVGARGRGG